MISLEKSRKIKEETLGVFKLLTVLIAVFIGAVACSDPDSSRENNSTVIHEPRSFTTTDGQSTAVYNPSQTVEDFYGISGWFTVTFKTIQKRSNFEYTGFHLRVGVDCRNKKYAELSWVYMMEGNPNPVYETSHKSTSEISFNGKPAVPGTFGAWAIDILCNER